MWHRGNSDWWSNTTNVQHSHHIDDIPLKGHKCGIRLRTLVANNQNSVLKTTNEMKKAVTPIQRQTSGYCIRRTLLKKRFYTSMPLFFCYHLILNLVLLPAILTLLSSTDGSFSTIRLANACHSRGRYRLGRHIPKKIVPMVCGQHIPNVSENTIGASGPSEGKITRDSKRYRDELKSNWNPNIFFRDEEGTMADHMMTERCRDCLNRLAIMVAERWKNKVILRVVEAWDEDGAHEPNSLHYEGRAVDITTNDTDRSKYGILARLAVEAGFDWVYYQSKFHVHCSVKSDKSDAARYGGCFAGDSVAYRPDGTAVQMSQLLPGDSILSVDWRGRVVVDKIISFMDRIPPSKKKDIQSSMKFLQISTENGNVLKLTRNHLLYAIKSQDPDSGIDTGQDRLNSAKFIYAESVEVGDYVLEIHASSNKTNFLHRKTKLSRVGSVTAVTSENGAYAPLTEQGTILVNGVAASCYAVFNSHKIAHWTMAPLRLYNKLHDWRVEQPLWRDIPNGVPWYPRFLYKLGSAFFSEYMYQI